MKSRIITKKYAVDSAIELPAKSIMVDYGNRLWSSQRLTASLEVKIELLFFRQILPF